MVDLQVIVAEKPSMGRTIAEALGVSGRATRSFIEGNGVIVTWARGHLGELAEPDAYGPELKRWTWGSLPILPERFKIAINADAKEQFAVVRDLLARPEVTEVVNACDAGREGEYIFDLIFRLSRCQKPVKRLWPKSATDQSIRDAYQTMKSGAAYHGLRDAARCRSEADWLVGMNGTRALTLLARRLGIQLKKVASMGRVQTPVLMMLYQRYVEIRDFVPQDFWTVHADFSVEGGTYSGKWFYRKDGKEQDRLDREDRAEKLIALLKGHPATVASVKEESVRRQSEMLYDLTTLQREANKRFGFTAERTLEIAQVLYEEVKCLSYPRTNARHLTTDDLAMLPKYLDAVSAFPDGDYQDYVQTIRSEGWDQKPLGTRYVNDAKVEDHPALTPTEEVPRRPLSQDEKKIYDLVVRRMLAMFYPERVEAKTTIITEINTYFFKTIGTLCKQEGWSLVDPATKSQREGSDDEAASLPLLQQGQSAGVEKIYSKKGKTTAPKPYTEDTILGAMETAGKHLDDDELKAAMKDQGLGTPATRAATIEKLLRYGLIARKKKTLEITLDGIQTIEMNPNNDVKSPSLTGEWESRLAKMQRGEYPRDRFMQEVKAFTTSMIEAIKHHAGSEQELAEADQGSMAEPLPLPCPKDGATLFLRRSRDGRYYAMCENYKRKGKNSCTVAYDTDAEGAPKGGLCKFDGCDAPVLVTRGGNKKCVGCDRWQEDENRDTGQRCDRCKEQNYILITFLPKGSRSKKSFFKCEACGMSRDTDAVVIPGGCKMEDCGGDLVEQNGKHGRYRRCAQESCGYKENIDGSARQGGGAPGKGGAGRSGWTRTPTDETCPKCKKNKLALLEHGEKGTSFYGCSDPKRVCDFKRFPERSAA